MAGDEARQSGRLTIGGLIDIEHRIARDRDASGGALRRREAAIAADLPADLDDRRRLLRWARAVDDADRPTVGDRVEQGLEMLGAGLGLLGVLLGFGAVWGWLTAMSGRPINVVHFWTVLIGVQWLLLIGWVIACLPREWTKRLPGLRGLAGLLEAIGLALPRIGTWMMRRFSGGRQSAPASAWGRLKAKETLYGRLRFWLLMQATQLLAVGFNVGLIAAFVLAGYVADPSFGWRSTLMTDAALAEWTELVATPWAWAWPALPSEAEIEATRYSSLERRFVAPPDGGAAPADWAAWFPFLLASLITYGLVPRVLTWGWSRLQVGRQLRRIPLDHAEAREVLRRLHRSRVRTQSADDPDAAPSPPEPGVAPAPPPTGGSAIVLRWPGVRLEASQLQMMLRERFDLEVIETHQVGGLDPAADQAILQRAGQHDKAVVVVVVEAWEPPVGDYLDFLKHLRQQVDERQPRLVLLYAEDAAGAPVAPEEKARLQWQRHVGALGDPYLRVEPLVREEEPA